MPEILRLNIACSSYDEVVRNCVAWAADGRSHGVTFAPVHVVMEAHDKPEYRAGLNSLDMVNPDGMPVVWALRLLGHKTASRVYGPDATVRLLEAAQQRQIPIGFYGGSETALRLLTQRVQQQFPRIQIVYAFSPPFRKLSSDEDAEIVRDINASGARFLFIGLGCPKQEQWVIDHRDRIPAVLLAVGAAFDFLAGTKPQAPRWMMRSGLEWLFRFATEPRRLAGRYIRHNPRFVALFVRQWLSSKFAGVTSEAV
jgi:N-acetylglucosaminyldiphosphoundecaprenol N-acetyl-beta-D-mannosaminyltransferase